MAAKTVEAKARKAIRRLEREGKDVAEVLARMGRGDSLASIAKDIGINPRALSDLKGVLPGQSVEAQSPGGAREDEGETSLYPDIPVTSAKTQASAMSKARDLIVARMPLEKRIEAWTKLAKSAESEQVRMKALERIDDLMGLIPAKTPHEPDPPPLFALPANTEPDIMAYEDWIKDHPEVFARVGGGGGGGAEGGSGGEPGGGGGGR